MKAQLGALAAALLLLAGCANPAATAVIVRQLETTRLQTEQTTEALAVYFDAVSAEQKERQFAEQWARVQEAASGGGDLSALEGVFIEDALKTYAHLADADRKRGEYLRNYRSAARSIEAALQMIERQEKAAVLIPAEEPVR